jgi:type IV pilus assembly protein PilE
MAECAMTDDSLQTGFSLVELMVALAIAAFIAAFAVPSYRDHALRGQLPEMSSALQLGALRLEEYYQDHRSYRNDKVCGVVLPTSDRFILSCTSPLDGQSFLLTATGSGALDRFAYTIDHQGQTRTITLPEGWGSTPRDCWILKRGTTC